MAGFQAAVILALAGIAQSVNNGLARTPQMGWVSQLPAWRDLPRSLLTTKVQNNWNSLGCDVSESLLLDTSKELVDSGLRDVGYNYVVLDDCWSDGRDDKGYLKVDLNKFPSGMAAVADEIHKQGLLYGMYSSAGEMTCARFSKRNSIQLCSQMLTQEKLARSTSRKRMLRASHLGELTISSTTIATIWADGERLSSHSTVTR